MGKTDLASAINALKDLPEIKYNQIGSITNQLMTLGFDAKTAKMAVMTVYESSHPDVSYLKNAGVNAMQAAKSMYDANIPLGEILDKLLQMGFLKNDASNAIDALNLDESNQEVNDFLDDDVEYKDQSSQIDSPKEYGDIPPEAIREILEHAQHEESVDANMIEEVLLNHGVSSTSIDELNKELFAKTASVELSWRELGLMLQDSGIEQDQIIKILVDNGASEEEAHAASLPLENYPEGNPPGAVSDAPEDLDLGASGDFPYGAGMDEDGPGGLNDSLEGAPGPNDFDATGGGYMGGPDDTEDGDFFNNPSTNGDVDFSDYDEDENYLEGMAQDYVASDPQMTHTDLVSILKNNGATEQEATQVADKMNVENDSAIRPGVFVRAGVGTGRVTSVWETMYGKMANVESDRDGKEYEYAVEDLTVVEGERFSNADRFELEQKIAEHLNGDWYDNLEVSSSDYRDTYSSRIKQAKSLYSEINNRLAVTKDLGEIGRLTEARTAISNEISFCQTRLSSSEFIGEQEYVDRQPRYEFGKEAVSGYDFGPGGGESMMLVAAEMEEELEQTDWNEFTRVASVDFVSEVSPVLLGDAQEVARLAIAYVEPKVAMLSQERSREVTSEFLANVEMVRRSMASTLRTSGVQQEIKESSVNESPAPWDEEGWAKLEAKESLDKYAESMRRQMMQIWDQARDSIAEDNLVRPLPDWVQDPRDFADDLSNATVYQIIDNNYGWVPFLQEMLNNTEITPDMLEADAFETNPEGERVERYARVKTSFDVDEYNPHYMTDEEIYTYWMSNGFSREDADKMVRKERDAAEREQEIPSWNTVEPGARNNIPMPEDEEEEWTKIVEEGHQRNSSVNDISDEGWLL